MTQAPPTPDPNTHGAARALPEHIARNIDEVVELRRRELETASPAQLRLSVSRVQMGFGGDRAVFESGLDGVEAGDEPVHASRWLFSRADNIGLR